MVFQRWVHVTVHELHSKDWFPKEGAVVSHAPVFYLNFKLKNPTPPGAGQDAQVQMGLRALHNATAENPNPLAVAGRVVEGQRRASPQEEDERIAAYEQHSLEGLLQRECV